jgi:hypothetical protein
MNLGDPPPPYNCTSIFQANPNEAFGYPHHCALHTEAVRLVSYQGIMAAFNEMFIGSITSTSGYDFNFNTTVASTILAQTTELAFLRGITLAGDVYTDLRTFLLEMNSSAPGYQGLVNPHLPNSRGQLKVALEEIFQNYTVSLLAEPYLQ